jgi:hypothetical protein
LYLLKNQFLLVGTTDYTDISSEFFLSLLSFHPKLSLSSSHFLSALSSLFALSMVRWLGFLLGYLLKHETGWLGLAGVVLVDGGALDSVVGLPDLGVVMVNRFGG